MTKNKYDREQTILVVDDNPESLELLVGMLTEKGYIVRPAPSGKVALMTASVNPPDIMLLDIRMPQMDGYEVCRRFKGDKSLKDIPIIFLTGLTESDEKIKAFAAGGVDYITKPFEPREVEARIKTHLTIRNQKRQLQESAEAKYYNIFDNALEGIFQVAPNGKLLTANHAFIRMHGYDRLEEIEFSRKFFVQPGTYNKLTSALEKAGRIEQFEAQAYRKDKETIWVSMNVRAVTDEDGKILYYEGMVGDITRQKESEERLKQSEQDLRTLVDAMNDTILVIDKNGRFLEVNTRKEGQLYMTGNAFIGKPLKESFEKDMADLFLKNVRHCLTNNETVNIEYSVEREEGEHWFTAAISPMSKKLALWVARDITQLKMAENKLEAKSIRLEEMNTTLNILLEKMKESNAKVEETMYSNIKAFVTPYVDSLKKLKLTDVQKTYIELIEINLSKISSPLIHSMLQFNLTPMEIEVANLVKVGRSTKDIARILNTSKVAIDIHRYNIRKKFGLNNDKKNLRMFLLSLN